MCCIAMSIRGAAAQHDRVSGTRPWKTTLLVLCMNTTKGPLHVCLMDQPIEWLCCMQLIHILTQTKRLVHQPNPHHPHHPPPPSAPPPPSSVICYFGHHYQAFVLSEELQQWLLFDDHVIKLVGDWVQVKAAMVADRLQPSLLFYEAAAAAEGHAA